MTDITLHLWLSTMMRLSQVHKDLAFLNMMYQDREMPKIIRANLKTMKLLQAKARKVGAIALVKKGVKL